MIRVLLVDDQRQHRSRLCAFLSSQHDIEVVGEAEDTRKALELVAELQPQVVLMAVQMPLVSGIAATRHICTSYPEIQIVLLASVYHHDDAVEARQAGVTSYLLKDASAEEILLAIRTTSQVKRGMSAPPIIED